MKNGERPTGIIRTLPRLYAKNDEAAYANMLNAYEDLAAGRIDELYIALAQKPTQPVLHMYVLIDGKIICRMNIASYVEGGEKAVECWDQTSRAPAFWAVCTTPISFPSEPILRRGFQGFRYTEDLW